MSLDHVRTCPTGNKPIHWGILGTGAIAQRFAEDFAYVKDGTLLVSGSRSIGRAQAFAERFRIPYWYGSYQALIEDPRIEAVYVATPASEHTAGIELCLRAGKAVLCEKPLTVNAREAEKVITLARESGVFLMEAMWTRFLPLIARLRELLAQNVIGEVRHVMADLSSEVEFDPASRVFNPELGGGALLQKGVYLLSLMSMMLGSPVRVKSLSILGESGIDDGTTMLLEYPKGRLATLSCSVRVRGHREAVIAGTHGHIVIHGPITCPSTLTLRLYGPQKRHQTSTRRTDAGLKAQALRYAKRSLFLRRLRERFPMLGDRLFHGMHSRRICDPPIGEGLHYQATEVNRCLRAGQLESHMMPLNESLAILKTLDLLRADGQKVTSDSGKF